MTNVVPPTSAQVVPGRRGIALFLALLAAFVAVPWLVRPLESLLPLVDVALVGSIVESALGVILGVWMFRTIRQQRRLAAVHASEIERLTESDALTGLGNVRALRRDLELTLNRARRTREPVTLLYVDIDAMDDVNRRHGRVIADQTLRTMGAVVRSSVRYGVDAGYRLAAEQFAIVLAADREGSQAVTRRLEWNFQERTPRRSNLSVGVATWDGRCSVDGLLEAGRRAQAAQRQTSMVAQLA